MDENDVDDATNFQSHDIKLIVPDEDDGDGDESISLCDFPLNSDRKDSISKNNRRSTSEPADFFEFLNDFASVSEISHAEDIFYCGRLVPYAPAHRRRFMKSLSEHNQYHYSSIDASSTTMKTTAYSGDSLRLKSDDVACRRSSVLPRNRYLEHPRNPRHSDIRRSSSKSSAKSEASSRDSRPKWFVLMFGRPLKFHQEWNFRGVRSRQIRRNPGSIFPAGMDAGEEVPGNRRNGRSFWSHDLLRVLSCKDDASAAVTASVVLVPHF